MSKRKKEGAENEKLEQFLLMKTFEVADPLKARILNEVAKQGRYIASTETKATFAIQS